MKEGRSHIQQFARLRFWLLEYLITARQQSPSRSDNRPLPDGTQIEIKVYQLAVTRLFFG
jgi:hypothetical protein